MDILQDLVFEQRQPVTLRQLSRSLGIKAVDAQQIMTDFVQAHHAVPIYYIRNLSPTRTHIYLGSLSDYEALENKTHSHIYACAPAPVMDMNILQMQNSSVADTAETKICASIVHSTVEIVSKRAAPIYAPMKLAAKAPMLKPSLTSAPAKVSKKASFFGSKTVKPKVTPSAIAEDNSISNTDIALSDIDEPIPAAPVKAKPVVAKPAIAKPVKIVSGKSKEESKKIQQMFADEPEVQPQKRTIKVDSDEEPLVPQRIRKRRKIKSTKTVMEGKYMKTVDVTDWESYSEDETPKPKAVAVSSHTASKNNGNNPPTKGQKKMQKSIASFFGKPKSS